MTNHQGRTNDEPVKKPGKPTEIRHCLLSPVIGRHSPFRELPGYFVATAGYAVTTAAPKIGGKRLRIVYM
jgi:hypothetical protein